MAVTKDAALLRLSAQTQKEPHWRDARDDAHIACPVCLKVVATDSEPWGFDCKHVLGGYYYDDGWYGATFWDVENWSIRPEEAIPSKARALLATAWVPVAVKYVDQGGIWQAVIWAIPASKLRAKDPLKKLDELLAKADARFDNLLS